jgi:sRNA-binding regulator protein Hfq
MPRDGMPASNFHQLLGTGSEALGVFKHAITRLFKYECPIETNHQRQQ